MKKVWHVVPVRIIISFNVFNIFRPVENSISATVIYQHLLSFWILGETFLLVFYTSATVKAKKTTTGEHSSKWFEPWVLLIQQQLKNHQRQQLWWATKKTNNYAVNGLSLLLCHSLVDNYITARPATITIVYFHMTSWQPNQSCGSWTLFLCKRFLLFQWICIDAGHVSENTE